MNTFLSHFFLLWLITCQFAMAGNPNVIVIMTDDQGWGDLSAHGNTNLSTPHIDSLARDGVSFDRFYVSPVCSPTRAEFLTGRFHPRSGVLSTSQGGERMNADEQTIADVFKAAGYATALFGKWHSGMQWPYHPNARGFEEFYGFCSGHWGDYFSPWLEHNGEPVTGDGFLGDDLTQRAMQFMSQGKMADKPFCLCLSYNTPHSPMQVPDQWWKKISNKPITQQPNGRKKEDPNHTRAAWAMCENIDWNVGRLLAKIDELKITGQTLILFLSDNGPNGARWNGGMKGIKGSVDEGGVRSPLLVRWPGKVPAGKRVAPISAVIDLLPTLATLADIPLNSPKPLDGVNLAPLLTDPEKNAATWPARKIFSHWAGKVSVRTQQYRLDAAGRLYDMIADPGQGTDVATAHPEITQELQAAAAEWKKTVLPANGKDERPFVIAHPAVPWTHLPARDAIAHGTIKRSSIHPNCSYFLNWTSTRDKITWDVEVAASGKYDVLLWYACPKGDVGSTIELSFGNSRLVGRVIEAHEPPLVGREHDRAPRTESYVKDFRAMKLGEIELEKGAGILTLQATQIPGRQAMEFRQLTLKRVK
jgi:arylsulfatase A-like enzyme